MGLCVVFADFHLFPQAAMCYVHVAALVAEYLHRKSKALRSSTHHIKIARPQKQCFYISLWVCWFIKQNSVIVELFKPYFKKKKGPSKQPFSLALHYLYLQQLCLNQTWPHADIIDIYQQQSFFFFFNLMLSLVSDNEINKCEFLRNVNGQTLIGDVWLKPNADLSQSVWHLSVHCLCWLLVVTRCQTFPHKQVYTFIFSLFLTHYVRLPFLPCLFCSTVRVVPQRPRSF